MDAVLCELEKVDRRKKSRANREQLRCCNWIRLTIGPIVVEAGVPLAWFWDAADTAAATELIR